MTTFIFSQALSSINSKKNQIINLVDDVKDSFGTTTWKKDKITGKLSEISIQASSYNKVIPLIYGTNRIAGNIIWLGDIKEVYNTNTTSIKIGKGQKIKQTSIEYFYYLSFAISICKGEVEDIKNIWADSTLLDLKKYKYRFYNGTSNQEPDSLMEAINGIGKTPAYRDMCYIVFENFPLTEFNNRIPNFLFEITRKNDYTIDENSLDFCVKGINLMPCNGYSRLNTKIQYRAEDQINPDYIPSGVGSWTVLNQNNSENIADGLLSLNQLLDRFVNCEWVVPHIAMFADSLNIKDCELKPRVDFNVFTSYPNTIGYPIYTKPDSFKVGTKWNRYNTPLLGKNSDGTFRFNGASFGDNDVLSFFKELKNRNKKTVFCPEILVDIENTPSYKLLNGSIEDIDNFFKKNNGYNEFILHYANLLKDYIDVFLIGNELTSITSIHDENYNFVGVNNLIELAKQVKEIVGKNVKVSYSAGFKEYHSLDGYYNLDKLWASEYIDFVGIKAFFPLTNCPQDSINKDLIKQSWFSGEGYDYIIVDDEKINIEDKDGYKNIEYWWDNKHINKDGSFSPWSERLKKIWFTEYGFRSIDGATNEPYKVVELPVYSTGDSNFYAQRIAIEATEEVFKNVEYIENKFVYYWDIRPYPYYPNKVDIWKDGENWKYDYSLNGKVGLSNAKVSITQIFKDADIDLSLLDNINLDEFINGFVINNTMTVRDVFYILQKVYFFDCVEKNGKIAFISNKNNNNIIEISNKDLIEISNNKYINIELVSDKDLPQRVNLIFLDKNRDYDTNSVYVERTSINNNNVYVETIPIILEESRAKTIAETILYSTWLERITFDFILPLNYIYLETSDIVSLIVNDYKYILKITNISIENYTIKVQAKIFDNTIYNVKEDNEINDNIDILQGVGDSNLNIVEVPALNNDMIDKINVFFVVSGELKTWRGAYIYESKNNNSYNFLFESRVSSGIGSVLKLEQDINIRPYYFDKHTKIIVNFNHNIDDDMFKNIDTILSGENIALYGKEIIQFNKIVLNEDGTYTISELLRGLFDTEDEINNHKENEIFVLLNEYTNKQIYDYDKIDYQYYYKINSIDGDNEKSYTYYIKGTNLKPMKVCFLKYKKYDNYLHVEWKEKSRGYVNWLNNRDHMSIEKTEKYYLEFLKNEEIIYSTYVENKREYDYYFDTYPDKLKICQVNDLYGFGLENIIYIN